MGGGRRRNHFNLLVPCFVLLYTSTLFFCLLCLFEGGRGWGGGWVVNWGGLLRGGGSVDNLATSVLTLNICTVCQNGLTHVSMKSSC